MALGNVVVNGVTPDKMELLVLGIQKEYGGTNVGSLKGSFKDHHFTVDYVYDGSNEVTFTIEKITKIFGHSLVKVADAQQQLLVWVEATLAGEEVEPTEIVEPLVVTSKTAPAPTEEIIPEVPSETPATINSSGKVTVPIENELPLSTIQPDPITQQPVVPVEPVVVNTGTK